MPLAVCLQQFKHCLQELLSEQIEFLSNTDIVLEISIIEDEVLAGRDPDESIVEVMVDDLS